MKKIVVLMIMTLLMGVSAWCQHMMFKGVEMKGSVENFSDQLQKKGLSKTKSGQEAVSLKGDFAGQKDCTVYLSGNGQGEILRAVVCFPKQESWSGLSSDFSTMKSYLTQKYGEPVQLAEEVQEERVEDFVFLLFCQVLDEQVLYGSTWKLKNGTIELQLKGVGDGYAVVLSYTDSAAQQQATQQILEDL